jgi:hypothetical protein
MHVTRGAARLPGGPPRQGRAAVRARFALVAMVVSCALLALGATASPAAAQGRGLPLQLNVIVVAPSNALGPRPGGSIAVSIDRRRLLSIRLQGGLAVLTSITPQLAVTLKALGHRVTISYSGDSNYEASTGISVTLPTRSLLTIVARPRDSAAPAIEILSPGDGVRYARGEAVVASYSCADPDDRSQVTQCDAPVALGGALDTSSAGTYTFTVKTEDALGNAASKTATFEVGDVPGPDNPYAGDGGGSGGSGGGGSGGGGSSGSGGGGSNGGGGGGGGSGSGGGGSSSGSPGAVTPAAPPPGAPVAATLAVASPPGATPGTSGSPTARIAPQPGTGSSPRGPGSAAKAAPTIGSSKPLTARPASQELAPYDARSEPAKVIAILVAAFTLLQLGASRGGLALARGGGGVVRSTATRGSGAHHRRQASGPSYDADYGGVDIEFLGAGLGAVALGDRSRTWSWPGTSALDALSATLPVRLARRSPLLARVAADGTYLRAILGSASLLALLAGLALGVVALRDTGGEALAPVASVTIAIAVLGVFDAAAGLVAVLIFTTGVLVLGGVDSYAHLRLMLGLSALWFVVPVLAGAARPLRRPPTRSLEQSWDRAADFVIASLIGAWAVQKIVLALPGLAGVRLPIAEHANAAAYCVLAALVARLAFETIASHLYPRRLDLAEAAGIPEPGALLRLGATALRMVIFVFFAYIVVGTSWQLWVGAALFVAPQVLAIYEPRFPNSPALFRALPKGLPRLVLMLFVGTAVGALLLRTMNQKSDTFVADSFVLLSLPGFLLSLVSFFGREGNEPPIGWGKRIAGIALLVGGILLVLGLLL